MKLPAWASEYVGIPYTSGGRTRSGLDCWGLAILVLHEQFHLSIPDYEYDDAANREEVGMLVNGQKYMWHQTDSPDPGNLALFRIIGHPCHVGIMLTRYHFLHVRRYVNSCIQRIDHQPWARCFDGYYHYVATD